MDPAIAAPKPPADARAAGSAPAAQAPHMDGRAWAMLVALSGLWGGSFVFTKIAVGALPPLTIVTVRVALACAALTIIARLMGHAIPRDAASVRAYLALGVLNNVVPFSLIVWGQTRIGAGLASILNAATPIFTVLVAHALTRDEKASGPKLAGVATGFVGVAVLVGPGLAAGLGAHVWAELACLGAAFTYAFASVFGRRFGGRPPLVTAAGQLAGSTAVMIPLSLLVDRPWTLPLPGAEVVAALLALALLSTALAYVLFFTILARAGATNVGLVTLLVPVSALALSALWLGERPGPNALGGFALIALGLVALDGRLARRFRRSRGP